MMHCFNGHLIIGLQTFLKKMGHFHYFLANDYRLVNYLITLRNKCHVHAKW